MPKAVKKNTKKSAKKNSKATKPAIAKAEGLSAKQTGVLVALLRLKATSEATSVPRAQLWAAKNPATGELCGTKEGKAGSGTIRSLRSAGLIVTSAYDGLPAKYTEVGDAGNKCLFLAPKAVKIAKAAAK